MSWTVPELKDCDPGIEPFEYQVLVRMAAPTKVTSGGVILADATHFKQSWGSDHALLVAVAPAAFSYHDWASQTKMPTPGDAVFVGQFPGHEIVGRDGEKYRLCADREIRAVLERAEARVEKLNAA